MPTNLPAPKFKRFERVIITGRGPHSLSCNGERGTVVWLDSYYIRRQPNQPDKWTYIVHLPSLDSWKTFFEADLESEGDFDSEAAHLGNRAEMSFDIVLEEENDWAEGSYRLPGEFWKVMIFRRDDVPEVTWQSSEWQKSTDWEQEITGLVFRFPQTARMGRDDLLHVLSQATGCPDWVQVQGPDSIVLR